MALTASSRTASDTVIAQPIEWYLERPTHYWQSTDAIGFGNVLVGQSGTASFTIQNTGGGFRGGGAVEGDGFFGPTGSFEKVGAGSVEAVACPGDADWFAAVLVRRSH